LLLGLTASAFGQAAPPQTPNPDAAVPPTETPAGAPASATGAPPASAPSASTPPATVTPPSTPPAPGPVPSSPPTSTPPVAAAPSAAPSSSAAAPSSPPSAGAASAPPTAAAAAAGEAGTGAPAQTRLSDVVVTAKKRVEKAQDVPLPIAVASGQQIIDENITTSNDVARITPNLSGQVTGSRSTHPRWFLRGIGTNDSSVNLESPISIYVDEVLVGYTVLQSFPLFDLERVEVLKGPQGTLWGKNTTGGAISFVSRKPTFDPSGYVEGGLGDYGYRSAQAAYGGGILGDRLAARASFFYDEQSGWATNIRDGSKGPQFNDFNTRLQLLGNVTDDLDILVSGRLRLLNQGQSPSYFIGSQNGVVQPAIQPYPNGPTYTPSYGDNPQIGDSFWAGPQSALLQTHGATATINYHFTGYTLTSIAAVDVATNDSQSLGYNPNPAFDQTGGFSHATSRQITEELRLTSPKADRFNWIAGLQYFDWHFYNDSASAIFGPTASRKNFLDNRINQTDDSPAAFASATFNFTKALALTGGLRYTYDTKTVESQRLNATGAGVTFSNLGNWNNPTSITSPLTVLTIPQSADWSQVTYDVTPEYKITKDVLAFFRFAKGFRAGVFNPTIIPAVGTAPAYLPKVNPEVLYDAELGLKSAWFDGRLVANAGAFYYLLHGIQLNVQQPNPNGIPGASTSTVQNAASGNVKGLELEVNALPIKGLRLQGGLGLLKATYTDFLTYQGTNTVNASGNAFYRTPRVSATLSAEYRVPVTQDTAVALGTDWLFRSMIYDNAVIQNDPVQTVPGYAIGNVELRYIIKGGRLTVQGYVKNVANADYRILSQVVASGAYPTNLGDPRTLGVELISQF
jgi:iron complex outermembrane recepter protein